MIWRRFLNIVADKRRSGSTSTNSSIYSLHRLDVSKHLFYPSTAEARAAAPEDKKKIPTLRELPAPAMSFQVASSTLQYSATARLFALLSPRASEGRILCSDNLGHSFLFDADLHCTATMPVLRGQLGRFDPITVSVPRPVAPEREDLYVLNCYAIPEEDSDPSPFGVLRLSGGFPYSNSKHGHLDSQSPFKDWLWESLTPPPFDDPCSVVSAHAVLDGGRTICVSTGPRTYYFDTVNRQWHKAAGDWELPFEGGAEYVPGADLWLGFIADSGHLCAMSGLSAAMDRPPALQHVWPDAKIPPNWKPRRQQLVDLGHGRFCVAKVVAVYPDDTGVDSDEDWMLRPQLAVLSGVELITDDGGEDGKPQGALSIVEHRSLCYSFVDNSRIEWVL